MSNEFEMKLAKISLIAKCCLYLVLVTAGIVVYFFVTEKSSAPKKLRMPGTAKISLMKKGEYTVWYIYKWKSKGIDAGYQSDIATPILLESSTKRCIPIEPLEKGNHIGFSYDSGEGEKLCTFNVTRPGIYELTMFPTAQGAPYLVSVVQSEMSALGLGSDYTFRGLFTDF